MTPELEWVRIFKTTNCPVCRAKPGQRCGNPERWIKTGQSQEAKEAA